MKIISGWLFTNSTTGEPIAIQLDAIICVSSNDNKAVLIIDEDIVYYIDVDIITFMAEFQKYLTSLETF